MKQFTSEAAKSLITIIGTEYLRAQTRVNRNFVEQDRMLGYLFERLNLLACQNIDLRKFLDKIGHIPIEEDTAMDLDWSKDPRDEEDKNPQPEDDWTSSGCPRRFTEPDADDGPKRYVTRESGNILNSSRRVSKPVRMSEIDPITGKLKKAR